MTFGPVVLDLLETALTERWEFHDQLDSFILRSGIPENWLADARLRAEKRAENSRRDYSRAPKRFVAQELLNIAQSHKDIGQKAIGNLVSFIIKLDDDNNSTKAAEAIEGLKKQFEIAQDAKEKNEQLKKQREKEDDKRKIDEKYEKNEQTRANLLNDFNALISEVNVQKRGYVLEDLLKRLFELERLFPRGSFRNKGEQIDGSFEWQGNTVVLEAKWVSSPVSGSEFGAFISKISGKSANTRGLYVSVNGYSLETLEGLHGKGELRFVCIDGAHLYRALQPGQTLSALLRIVWRYADETGNSYLPVSDI